MCTRVFMIILLIIQNRFDQSYGYKIIMKIFRNSSDDIQNIVIQKFTRKC